MTQPVHYGWLVSPYSAKTRSYLQYKQIPFVDRVPSARQLYFGIRGQVGRMIMPTVELPGGSWLQDTSDIIDHFEQLHPERSIVPDDPTQRVASALLELLGDEWLPMAALHFRWNDASNADFALAEFGRSGFPWLPGPLGRKLVQPFASKMQGYLEVLGVTPATVPGVEETVRLVLEVLETQLSLHPFLLGGRPCLGDFALYGPLWAHLYRDPGSRYLFDHSPAVVAWMDRLTQGARTEGEFLDGGVPESLTPLFRAQAEDQLAWVKTLVSAIDEHCSQHPDATRVPRALGRAPFVVRGCSGERKLVTFVQWKAQRVRRAYEEAAGGADSWLATLSDGAPGELIPAVRNPLVRVAFREVLEAAQQAGS